MKRLIAALLFCLLFSSLVSAQENQSPYEIALERISYANGSRASYGVSFSNGSNHRPTLNLAGLGLTELPPEIGTVSNVVHLDLRDNHLRSLPPEIGNLVTLQELSLSNNQLESLPAEFGNLVRLQTLDLSGNALRSFPSEIGNLVNLRSLDLSNNALVSLPPEIGNLLSLRTLSLAGNQLEALPSDIGQLQQLSDFDLSHNQLTTLPDEIAQLQALVFLDLSANRFRYLPNSLAVLKALGNQSVNCFGDFLACGLFTHDNPLISPPKEILERGTTAVLNYLENEAWWYLQKLIVGGVSALGLVTLSVLGLRWKNRRGKQKRKNEELA